MEQQLDLKLQALASVAADADMPRVLTGHFTVTGAVWGSERSVMLGRDVQVLVLVERDGAKLHTTRHGACIFVPLLGEGGFS